MTSPRIAIVGAGPAGLIAAEYLAAAGARVNVFERMPSPARKFLMAGRGGLNLTHSEDLSRLLARYGAVDFSLRSAIEAFPPSELIAWANSLGVETFTGTSGRVFPKAMKASPLLRAWLAALDAAGVELRTRVRWTGFAPDGALSFVDEATDAVVAVPFDATILALGGASWPRLGSDGSWVPLLAAHGVGIEPLEPANAGVTVAWSEHVRRHAGQPLKRIAVSVGRQRARGEAVITANGLEGGAIYALAEPLRVAFRTGPATLTVDLRPDLDATALAARLAAADVKQSMANTLRKSAALDPAHVALLNERGPAWTPLPRDAVALAARIKAAPVTTGGFAGLARAISSAGGVRFAEIDEQFMLRARPGVFVAGEMLDWTAPTGGYLLQASFATGRAAAKGAASWLKLSTAT